MVGWGAYTLIAGADRRTAFLARLRALVPGGAPILLSFLSRAEDCRRAPIVAAVANAVSRLRGGRRVELGDDLAPNFVHRLAHTEVAGELHAGGFAMCEFRPAGPGPTDSGYAVGLAQATENAA